MITNRDARCLRVDELRQIVNVCNNTKESLNTGFDGEIDLQAILDLHFGALDAGWDGFEAYIDNDFDAASALWSRVVIRARRRSVRG